jgi:CRP-like cAMP-binding protein
MASIARFVSRAERISRQKATDARQAVLDLQLPQSATETILLTIARHTEGVRSEKWTFHMLQPKQVLTVWDAIRALPGKDRPHQVRHLFDLVLTHLEWDTGLVILTREELAERIGTTPAHVSRMMGTLERIGVIFRERAKLEGMRGRGVARYRVNPHVAWHGDLDVRKEQAEQMPLPLTVIEGGKDT